MRDSYLGKSEEIFPLKIPEIKILDSLFKGHQMPLHLLPLVLLLTVDLITALCPQRCQCQQEKLIVDCKEAFLGSVPIFLNPEVNELYLSQNQIKSLLTSLTFYSHLTTLDISGNAITTFGRKSFASQRKLRLLLASRNRLTSLNEHSFTGLRSLSLLNLSDNLLINITGSPFTPLVSLEKLDLSRNRITTIDVRAFTGLTQLKSLSIRANRLLQIPTQAFRSTVTLRSLDVGLNTLTRLERPVFSPLRDCLVELYIDLCSIEYIAPDSLDFTTLKRLQLDGNRLTAMPNTSFAHLRSLRELVIGGNRFTTLSQGDFNGLQNLTILEMRYDHQLTAIRAGTFDQLTRLSRLIIEYCPKLTQLPADMLRHCNNLRQLSLRGNSLTTLDKSWANWSRMKSVDFRQNPLVCNCSLSWLSTLQPNISNGDIICNEPIELRGQRYNFQQSYDCQYGDDGSGGGVGGVGGFTTLTGVTGVVVIVLCLVGVVWCRSRITLYMLMRGKNFETRLSDECVYEKGRILDQQILFPPISPYHSIAPNSSLVYVQSGQRVGPVSQV